jgi:hypothetical protein
VVPGGKLALPSLLLSGGLLCARSGQLTGPICRAGRAAGRARKPQIAGNGMPGSGPLMII